MRLLLEVAAATERHREAVVADLGWPLAERLAALPKPIALFAAFDQCAATVLEICRELRLKVPKDVAVLGVDDDALICEHTRPKLTSIRPDHAGQGFAAARELDRLLSGKARRRNNIVCRHIGISERDSTSAIPPGVRIVREVNNYLDRHALEPIRVTDIVAHAGVSARLANLRYSEAKGRSIQELNLKARKPVVAVATDHGRGLYAFHFPLLLRLEERRVNRDFRPVVRTVIASPRRQA